MRDCIVTEEAMAKYGNRTDTLATAVGKQREMFLSSLGNALHWALSLREGGRTDSAGGQEVY